MEEEIQRIVVMGASTGGFEAFKTIIGGLPANFNAPILIVWHISAEVRGVLPTVLNKVTSIYAAHAYDGELIKPNRIYVAPPDFHLTIEGEHLRISRGPKENRFRPAIDPLFRSAAYAYGSRVIAIVLSGALDDGTAGLWNVKQHGGIAIVQDPAEAEVSSMPESAIRKVNVDYTVEASQVAGLLVELTRQELKEDDFKVKDERTLREIEIARNENALQNGILQLGDLSPFTCPDCHGILSRIMDGNIARFRCHTGHAFSINSLMCGISEKIEAGLYDAMRAMDERVMLLNHIGDHLAENNNSRLAGVYFKKAKETKEKSDQLRNSIATNENLIIEKLIDDAGFADKIF